MATRKFTLNNQPHVADIAGVELLLKPEVLGGEWLDGFEQLREAQKKVDLQDADPATLREVTQAMRDFLAGLMLPESAEAFAGMQLPDRILVQLVEWAAELYGGGSGGGRPTGPSSASQPRSPSPGTRSRANSR